MGRNEYQTWIWKIEQTGGNCAGIDLLTWINAADEATMQSAPYQVDCEDDPLPKMTQVRSACWKNEGGGVVRGCGSGMCLKSFDYCYDSSSGNQEVRGTISYQSLGTPSCDDDYEGLPPVGVCDEVPCGSNP